MSLRRALDAIGLRELSFIGIVFIFLILASGRVLTNLPWCDEGWFFDPVYNWITKGHTGTTIEEATGFPWEGIERHMYWQAPMHLLVYRVWLGVFGLTLFALRACSLVSGLIALFCWRYLFRYIGLQGRVLNASLLLVATDYAFLRAASDGRVDMIASAFGLGAVAAYLHFRERNFALAIFFSQILAVCGGLTHPMGGLLYLGYIAFFFITGRDWRRLRWSHLPIAAAPYLVGAASWGAYILEDPVSFKKIFFGSSASGRLSGILHPWSSLLNEIRLRYLVPNGWGSESALLRLKCVIPFVYFAGVMAALFMRFRTRNPRLQTLLSLWAIAFFGLYLLDGQRNGTYLAHVFPLCAALLAMVLCSLGESRIAALRVSALLVFTGFLFLQIAGSAYIIYSNPYRNDFLAAANFVQMHSRPGSHIVGTPELGFALGFDNVLDDLTLGYHNHQKPDIVVVNARYRTWFKSFQTSAPDIYGFVTDRLDREYVKAYEGHTFEVYLPR